MTGAREILEQFMSGDRRPVLGPFTHVEAVGLVVINEKLLDALKGMIAVPLGSGVGLLQAKLLAHRRAHEAVRLACSGGPVVDVAHTVGFHSITPVCGNCRHECATEGGGRTCGRHGWPVQPSATCGEHAWRPTVAKVIPIGCAA
jgi:hypothetical protein